MDEINKRIEEEADFILETGYTVRQIAEIFHVSKSTVHKDLHDRLGKINFDKYQKVARILNYHTSVRHIRGGESTRLKYLKI